MAEKLLFINSCIRDEETSRTFRLAHAFLDEYCAGGDVMLTELRLADEELPPVDMHALDVRDGKVQDEAVWGRMFRYANMFAGADTIVIAAPYWDMSFPAKLKLFFENACVNGITFRYTENGAMGQCRAQKLVYITTAGGFIGDYDFGFGYVQALCRGLFDIEKVYSLRAEMLDVDGVDVGAVLAKASDEARRLAAQLKGRG